MKANLLNFPLRYLENCNTIVSRFVLASKQVLSYTTTLQSNGWIFIGMCLLSIDVCSKVQELYQIRRRCNKIQLEIKVKLKIQMEKTLLLQ